MKAVSRRPDRVVKSMRLANGAERVEQYDFLGRLQLVEEPDGSWLRYGYDNAGHVNRLEHSSGETARFTRARGEIRAVTDRTETIIRLDASGFPTGLTLRADGNEWTLEYRRDLCGRVLAMRYPQSAEWLFNGKELRCGDQVYAEAGLPHLRFANGTSAVEEWSGDKPARLRRIAHFDAAGTPIIDQDYEYDETGRVSRAGPQPFSYDDKGRLTQAAGRRYEFDPAGRMVRAGGEELRYGEEPYVLESSAKQFDYDNLGRRLAGRSAAGTSHYTYNLFGQLASVELPGGIVVRYLYDGFGRLVGREVGGETVYYLVDFEGRRIAECDAAGQVKRSYLWFGPQCIGVVEGACGGPMVKSFHRVHGGTLAGVGDAAGRIQAVAHLDPYGADAPIIDGVPGYGCLFGDPKTGLLHAASRWLDPTIGQFLSADSWYGTDALEQLPRGMRTVFDCLPGGTARLLDRQAAYDWCSRDPVNYCDPNGHNFMGLVWAFISFFLWAMQVTSISLQMELISLVLFILFTFPGFMPAWNLDFWKKISPWNAIPPLLGSTRLMVPFAFPLNSIWNASGAVFTMGNVIWVRGEQLETLENTAQRDLIVCANADTYRASTDEVAADIYRVRSPNALGTANANAAGNQLTGVAVTAPAGAAIGDVFGINDWLSIRLPGAATDELRQISNLTPPNTFTLNPALPAEMQGQAVTIARLDSALVRAQKEDNSIARTITFVRGQALHIASQIPEGFPTGGLTVTEFMPSGNRRPATANAPREAYLIRLATAGDQTAFAANDFLRVRAGANYFARLAGRRRGQRDLILNEPLPTPALPTDYSRVEVVKMDPSGAPLANQTASGDRVNAGTLADLRRLDGLAIENTGGVPVAVERRIVTQLFLSCPVAALPNALQGVAIAVDLMSADASTRAAGTVTANNQITTAAGEAGRFSNGQPVRVRKAPSTDFFTTLTAVNSGANQITLADPLPAADFPNTTAVSVNLMTAIKRFEADPAAAPATQVTVKVDQPGSPAQNDVIRVRAAADVQGGALRQVPAAPAVVAQLDSALPATHANNLSVQRFAPVANTLKDNASAPLVQLRFTIQGGVNPYVQGDELHFQGNEEAWGRVAAPPVAQVIELEDPVEFDLGAAGIRIQHVTATGQSSADGKLQESLILIPSDLDEEPITRRRAVESHEMRHVWQYAVLGPFFFSFPLPWLIHLGFSFTDSATSEMKWVRHFSVGAVDSLFAVIAWGVGALFGAAPSGADVEGEITDPERKVITFPADTDAAKVAAFTEGSPCEAAKGDYNTFNIIEKLNPGEKKVTLRFSLESDKFAVSDRVKISVSPFDKIRSDVNKWFSLNLERLWSDHIPVAWGRALSKLLNRDSWFPLLGLYPIGFAMAGGNQARMHFEQDASYHSGDLYTNFAISNPAEIYVGQFSRVHGFLMGRGFGDTATGLSDINPLGFLTVETPTVAGVTPTAMVFGSVTAAAGRVRFRENYYMRMSDRVENVVGAFFTASQPGEYKLHVTGELTDDLVTTVGFDADFLKLRTIKVKSLGVTPAASAADPIFETEQVQFRIEGDPAADYAIRYKGAAPANPGSFDPSDSRRFTAPVLAAGPVVHNLEITATYDTNDSVFHGPGQLEPIGLTAAQLTNPCQALDVNIAPLAAPAIGPVQAGKRQQFQMPIAPASVAVTSALPAGATINASVVNGTGRPAQLTFIAPDAVAAPTNVTFDMVFGSGPTKTVAVTVNVTP